MKAGEFIRNNVFGVVILIAAVLLFAAGIYSDWLWFDSVDYLSVFKTALAAKILLGAGVFIAFFIILYLNILVIKKKINLANDKIFTLAALLVSLLAALTTSSYWVTALRFLNSVTFGYVDPIFKSDIGLYVFKLPFYSFILWTLFFLLVVALAMAAAAYFLSGKKKVTGSVESPMGIEQGMQQIKLEIPEKGKTHLAYLGGILFLVLAGLFFLKRYDILFSSSGAVYGAGFTDVKVFLPLYTILSVLSVAAALVAFSYQYNRNWKLVSGAIAVLVLVFFAGNVVGGVVQLLYVQPNEFNLEEKYLKQNIKHTLFAYDLTGVNVRDFPVTYNLSLRDLEKNRVTIENIRLWDWRPLLTTNKQIQLFRTYYEFLDVDVDRYNLDNKPTQVMVSPRELDQNQLDTKAQTWVNQKFVYTHGYGATVSPVNKISAEGLPVLFVKDIPPKTEYEELRVDQPRIYFGEKTDSFVVTNTESREFDYPLGSENVFTTYNGTAGIQLSSVLRKGIFSIKLGSLNLFISSAITPESKLLFRRNILERVSTIAPFLKYDSDPYIVIDEGRLFWILDAYTTTDKFPYSEATSGINYIRNSVKVVIDAFNGDVNFYVIEEDPIVKNYKKIFPNLFRNFEEMPAGLREHIRYPEDLMRIQTNIYGTYHMTDPQVFYNKEDVWRTPTEVYSGNRIDVRPYYVILELPNSEKPGFFLITPLIPRGKENMIAWFTAHSDPETYGNLEVFKLSKQELTYGPMQIEARIDQDTEISQLLTLWDQQGSEVIRGNLIVIPIENTFLYIEPVYLKASSQGALPELKRVIVAYKDKVTMQETLEKSLNIIFGQETEELRQEIEQIREEGGEVPQSLEEKFEKASQIYEEAQQALRDGNFQEYARKIEQLGQVLARD